MLEGLEISEVMLSSVANNNKSLRIDSTYFVKESEAIDRALKKSSHFFLKKAEVVSGPFGSTLKSHSYLQEGVPFVRVQNIKGGFEIQKNEIVYISEKDNDALKNSQLVVDDLVLSKVGNTIGYYARVDEELERCNISENNIGIKLSSYYVARRHYILAFLNSSYGKTLTLRKISGNAQPKLNVSDINDIPIPQRSEIFESQISFLIIESREIKHRSIAIYAQAEALLLKSLGLNHPPLEGGSKSQLAGDSGRGFNLKTNSNFNSIKKFSDPSPNASHSTLPQGEGNSSQYCYNTSINIKSFKDSFATTSRLDAEYYQPKYENYQNHVFSYQEGWSPLEKVCDLKDKNYSPNDEKFYQYIELADINKSGGITGFSKELGKDLPSRARRKVNAGDVLISSIEGSLSSCAIVGKEFENSLCSTGFYVIKSDKINSETLLVLFKSDLMQNILKQSCSGTILTAINKDEFLKIPLPLINPKTQSQISLLIQESFALKSKSEKLLELAKKAVEMAIEESEEGAMKFINQQFYSN